MLNKLKAIGISFLVTVVPAAVLFICCMTAGVVFNEVFEDLFFPLSILGILFGIPIGIVCALALNCGGKMLGVVNSNLVIFKAGNNIYKIDTNPSQTSAAKSGMIVSILIFLLIVPITLLIWLVSSVVLLCSEKRANIVIKNSKDSSKKALFLLGACTISLGLFCANFGLRALQDAKYDVNAFTFEYVSLEYHGDEWSGNLLGEASLYYLKYEFQNEGKVKGGLEGNIIIESIDGDKLELKDQTLTVYPANEDDFEKHLVEYYFYVSKTEENVNDMLKFQKDKIKISLVVKMAGWEGGFIESRLRVYDNGKQIVLKDFGVGGQDQSPSQTGGDNSGTEFTTEQKYQQAITYYNNGQYKQALEIFESLSGYKQSSDYFLACEEKLFYMQMENDLYIVAGNNAILPDDYLLNLAYSVNEYAYYNGNYYLSFYANFYCHRLEMNEYLNDFISKLIYNDYLYLSDGVYKKGDTVIMFAYIDGLDSFDYYAFKIS